MVPYGESRCHMVECGIFEMWVTIPNSFEVCRIVTLFWACRNSEFHAPIAICPVPKYYCYLRLFQIRQCIGMIGQSRLNYPFHV
jgi:hypothetical protein